jgi:ATP/maltotriose-dependent transcriptional regulator MalT
LVAVIPVSVSIAVIGHFAGGYTSSQHRCDHFDMPRRRINKTRPRPRISRRAVWLTGRELQVLGLMATGMKNREISAALSITHGTVKMHVHNILSKLDVTSRTGAITRALADHLLSI